MCQCERQQRGELIVPLGPSSEPACSQQHNVQFSHETLEEVGRDKHLKQDDRDAMDERGESSIPVYTTQPNPTPMRIKVQKLSIAFTRCSQQMSKSYIQSLP